MNQHEDFLEGFGDALGLRVEIDSALIQAHYRVWLAGSGMNTAERTDYESGGYETGLETGAEYRRGTQEWPLNAL